jgi:signal transduction histidine kinase
VVATIIDARRELFIAAAVIAVYTVASRANRKTAWLAGGITALAIYLTGGIWVTDGWLGPNIAVVAWIGMATAFGDATRDRRAYLLAVEERARRAELTREQEARRQVAEERLRIARDLHDVMAHHIAVINVHAGLANHTLRDNPDKAEESLGHVRQAAQTVLDELATVLSVLRQTGDSPAPTEPVPGLSRLGDLLESLASTGLRVGHQQIGQARPLPPAVDHAAYRIVQEALTNAGKHGSGTIAHLRIEYPTDAVIVDVTNPSPKRSATTDSPGHGLIGMRERTAAIGGTFTAGQATNQFHVHAVLPTASAPAPAPETTP